MSTLERPNVLIVDDREDKRLALDAVLCDLPVNLVKASSGREALRQILAGDFAVILLDVNMPGMDGFETAQMIRTRKSSRDTPIIFVTAHEDECFMTRGYSLGAVDYILQPVVPDVLRSKVSVFVDLYRKNQIVTEQSHWQRKRMAQLKRLAEAAVAINAAPSIQKTLQVITDIARELISANQAITLLLERKNEGLQNQPQAISSFSDKYAAWRDRPLDLNSIADTIVAHSNTATRLTARQLFSHPDWLIVQPLITAGKIPPVAGMLAAPLMCGNDNNLGLIYVSDAAAGDFTEDDESILVQLAQMGAVAIGNILNAEAREANRAKDQFIAVLSHELRTPLTPVLALLGGLAKDSRLAPDIADDLATIRRNVELEARLIDDLLDLTRISKGKIDLNITSVDAHEALRETMRICQRDIEEKSLHVSIALDAAHCHVRADATRLQQIFWNLLKNAVKFTPVCGHIEIRSADTSKGQFQLIITDTGIGIPPEILPRIFKAFEQGRASVTRQFGGLGLGLAITKMLVERHDGAIAVHSAGADRGATFSITLPLAQANIAALPKQPQSDHAAPRSTERRVLLVEDHPDTLRVMSRILRAAGYKVETANSVASGLKLAAQFEPEIVVSDLGLPDGLGTELMRRLRADHRVTGIAISGYGMEGDVARSKEAGFSRHLTKPLNPDLLLETLQNLEQELPLQV